MTTSTRPQSLANHRALPPASYLFAGLVLGVEVLRRGWVAVQQPGLASAWAVLVAVALCIVWVASRMRAMVVQDRLIRLEMRLRLVRLLGDERRDEIERTRLRHLIALRFASDAELPALFERVRKGELTTQDEIKRAVKDWQADWQRI